MKILEVRDGFIKIESSQKVEVSSFLEVKGLEKRYVAQVIRSKSNGTGYNSYAKLLFIYDGVSLKKYDKTMPDNTAELNIFPFDTVNNSFDYSRPIVGGKFISDNSNILLDSENFNNKTIMSIDNPESNNIIVQNLAKQFKQIGKTFIIDMFGVINGDKYVAGRDFKLPLNTESLQFLYEDCLNDATADSKSLIKEIFADLSQYSQEVKFLPFNALKLIVDDMVEKSHIFKLLVLKNKLAKFESAGYFATNSQESDNLSQILKSDFAVIDLSKIDGLFQNRYLSLVLSELENSKNDCFVFLEASNAINKRNIKSLISAENIHSTLISHSKFKYLADLKSLFKNYFIENSYTNKEIFNLYSFFIESMKQDNYLIVGEGTNFVPVISKTEKYDVEIKKLPSDSVSEEIIELSYDNQVAEETVNVEIPPQNEFAQENLITDEQNEVFVQPEHSSEDLTADVEMQPSVTEESQIENSSDGLEYSETESENNIYVDEIDSKEEIPAMTSIFKLDDNDESTEFTPAEENMSDDLQSNEIEIESEDDENKQENLISADLADDRDIDGPEIIAEPEESYNDEDSESVSVDIPRDLEEDFAEAEQNTTSQSEDVPDEETLEEPKMVFEPKILPLDNTEDEIGKFEEIDISDIGEEDILVDMEDKDQEAFNSDNFEVPETEDQIDKDIVEDVDRVFSTIKDDGITDNDLDLIDALNGSDNSEDDEMFSDSDMETLQELDSEDEEEGFVEPLEEISDSDKPEPEHEILEKRESSTPMVPIYDAGIPEEDRVISDDIEQGDTVMHAKYGSGVVEKMIKYGSKNLYSINFENVGRRLLDPTLTEIKKT